MNTCFASLPSLCARQSMCRRIINAMRHFKPRR
jgi:hypothetical protein